MSLKLQRVAKHGLPPSASHGFKLTDNEDERKEMFFHWHKDTPAPVMSKKVVTGTAPEGLKTLDPNNPVPSISYADVLKALPDRLAAMGYEEQTDEILGKVIEMFGAGGN